MTQAHTDTGTRKFANAAEIQAAVTAGEISPADAYAFLNALMNAPAAGTLPRVQDVRVVQAGAIMPGGRQPLSIPRVCVHVATDAQVAKDGDAGGEWVKLRGAQWEAILADDALAQIRAALT